MSALSGSREPSQSPLSRPVGFDPERIRKLVERCEAATGPDRELDGEIDRLFYDRPKHGDYDAKHAAFWRVKNGWSGLLETHDGWARESFSARSYTGSLDAAMTLVPEDWEWALENTGGDTFGPFVAKFGQLRDVEAKTLPLAICAAALKVRIAQGTEAQRAETVQLGSVHDGPVAESDAPPCPENPCPPYPLYDALAEDGDILDETETPNPDLGATQP